MTKDYFFEFQPSMFKLLGEELIHDKKIALSELVKNAYDADADYVGIYIEEDKIMIEDNGCGMSLDTIENVWLKPGVSSKSDWKEDETTEKYGRKPIGEKGIGRFGCHKLGDYIEVWTKSAGNKEIYLSIDWNKLISSKSLSDNPIDIKENEQPERITHDEGSGTRMVIKCLRDKWTEKSCKKLAADLINLISPFEKIKNFDVKLFWNRAPYLTSLENEREKISKDSLFNFNVVIEDGQLIEFQYNFTPWCGLGKVQGRTVDLENSEDKGKVRQIMGKIGKKYKGEEKKHFLYIDDNPNEEEFNYKVGHIVFQGYIYDLDSVLLEKEFSKDDISKIKSYLRENGGVRVYKDNLRIFNYGEKNHDLLDLDLKRVNLPAKKISSNQIAAAVRLSRKDSADLKEKTNREGFIHNDAFGYLVDMLDDAIDIISDLRQDDKGKIIRAYLGKETSRDTIAEKIESIKKDVENSDIEQVAKDKIYKKLDGFGKEYAELQNILLTAASAGVSLTIVVHELEKIAANIQERVAKKKWSDLPSTCEYLVKSIKAYKQTIRVHKEEKLISMQDIIKSAIFNINARLEVHNIDIQTDIPSDIYVSVKKNLIVGVVVNLFDNAIYWFDYQDIQDKQIIIKAYKKHGQIHLLFADNGLGFTISFDSAIMPFVTGRKDESSMGIGLHLTKQIMQAHHGFLEQGIFSEESLPEKFRNGAIIKLIFNEEK